MKKKDIRIIIEVKGKLLRELWFRELDKEVIEILEDFLDELSDKELHKNGGEERKK